jgi:GntR family transcriptional regulator / MocR family aminotransferase
LLIPLKLVRDQPLQQQLYDQLQTLIASARLQPGARMPSTRMLAEQFAISRITVLLTYERLIAEGYLHTVPAKGTFVARGPNGCRGSHRGLGTVIAGAAGLGLISPQAGPLTGWDHDTVGLVRGPIARTRPATDGAGAGAGTAPEQRVGRPDPSLFPIARWRALLRGVLDRFGAGLPPEHPAGSPVLRAAIAGWLSSSRGLAVAPDQVILVNGRQQALHIAARLLLHPGDRVVLEDPGDTLAACIYADPGTSLVRVPVDCDGVRTDLLPSGHAALVHVTPEHQRPLGVLLAPERRTALLDWAAQAGAMVLEEDCDGEFRYGGMEAAPLMSLDQADRVIHVGCFSTALGPWLTLGYMVVPRPLIIPALAVRRLIDGGTSWLEHSALAEFLESGAYARHVHRLRKAYLSRREALTGALRDRFGTTTAVWGGGAGLHLAWHVPPALGPAAVIADMARHCGLEAAAVAHTATQAVLLGFGAVSEQQIVAGVERLAAMQRTSQVLIAE